MPQPGPIQNAPYQVPIPDVERSSPAHRARILPGGCRGREAYMNPTDNALSKPAPTSGTYVRRQPREARDNRHRDSQERETSIDDCKFQAAQTKSIDRLV